MSNKMSKKKKTLLIVFVVCLALITFFICDYKYNPTTFQQGLTINGVDCSGLTKEEAKKLLIKKWNLKKFNIKKDGKVVDTINNLDLSYDINSELDYQLDPGLLTLASRKIRFSSKNVLIEMTVKNSGKKFDSEFNKLSILKQPKNTVKSENAYVDLNSSTYEIVKEVYGVDIDNNLVKEGIFRAIANGKFSMDFLENNYYAKPKILSSNEILANQQAYLKSLSLPIIKYKVAKGTVRIGNKDLLKMYGITDENLNEKTKASAPLKVSRKAVKRYVNKLANKYNTVGRKRKFKSTNKGTINVSGGDYGYIVNKDKEVKKLIKNLKEKKDVTRKIAYLVTPYDKTDEIGNSYVEIDLSSQKLWVYKNGKVISSSYVVTGNLASGYGTPPGVYYLKYKAMHTTLKGKNADGSDYESPVTYWMPFNGGIGMHDASWRSTFGGNIFRSNGSHGCVNMPRNGAASVYMNIKTGWPIVVHY